MNTYFYTVSLSNCHNSCEYLTCDRRCLSLLGTLPAINNLRILPKGSGFNTPSSMEMRSRDIMILYAGDHEGLERLVAQKDFFETFRIILIVGKEALVRCGGHYNLNPRYTSILGKDMDKLSAVLDRMLTCNGAAQDNSAQTQWEGSHV